MSYPPQQPGQWGGQPGWGQPGPGQQPGGYPQQGGYPQSGGFQQPGGGYPQSGPQPQQYGQPGQYDPYGQPGGFGQPGYGGYPPPKKSPMPWILAGGGVLVVGIVVVLIIVLTGGADTSTPQGVAEAAVSAANDQDIDALTDLTCGADRAKVEQNVDPGKSTPGMENIKVNFELKGVEQQGDDKATATVAVTYSGVPDEAKDYLKGGETQLSMKKENGNWCISFASGGTDS